MKMNLSKNLTLQEVIKSNTAARLGIDNEPTDEDLSNLRLLALHIFQPLREHFGVPIGISSGYRSEALNKAIGGSKTSQHSKGQALDIDADMYGKLTNSDIFNYIKEHLDFDQLIWEFGDELNPAWVHVSFKSYEANREEILQATRVNGKVKYIKLQ